MHKRVLVFCKSIFDLEDLLEPYKEVSDKKFKYSVWTEAKDLEERYKEFLETDLDKAIEACDEGAFRGYLKYLKDSRDSGEITLKEFATSYCGYGYNKETNTYGYYTNPKAKFDWWQESYFSSCYIFTISDLIEESKKEKSLFNCDSFITPDGKWYEKEESSNFFNNFINDINNKDLQAIMVDYHYNRIK